MNPRPNRELALQDYDGVDIPNSIGLDPSSRVVLFNRFHFKAYFSKAGVKQLGQPDATTVSDWFLPAFFLLERKLKPGILNLF